MCFIVSLLVVLYHVLIICVVLHVVFVLNQIFMLMLNVYSIGIYTIASCKFMLHVKLFEIPHRKNKLVTKINGMR